MAEVRPKVEFLVNFASFTWKGSRAEAVRLLSEMQQAVTELETALYLPDGSERKH